jgi:hypothetical protein
MKMCSKTPLWILSAMSVLLLPGGPAYAQVRHQPEVQFSGLLNDYTPSTVTNGPYEMRGTWQIALNTASNTADFLAEFNMETSDYGVTTGVVSPADPTTRGAHTHHIALKGAKVTWNMVGCPAFPPESPKTDQGFQFTGTVDLLAANGSPAPFETSPPSSMLQICVTGGDFVVGSVPYSNMTMQFVNLASGAPSPATKHFGTQAIHGVVTKLY